MFRREIFDHFPSTDHRSPAGDEGQRPRADDLALARQLLAGMPEDLARIAVYYYVDEMTHDEIASVMVCSPRHVGNLLDRLKSHVASQTEEP